MMWKNSFRLLIVTVGISMSVTLGQGCASDTGAPFHMYDSPLLEGRVESRYPKSRAYDPLQLGDHPAPETGYASKESGDTGQGAPPSAADTGGESRSQAQADQSDQQGKSARHDEKDGADKAPPALSTRRQAKQETSQGGKTTTESSARASSAEEAAPADDSAPALAADYIHSVYGLNGVDFSAAAQRSVPKLFRECKERGNIYHSSRPEVGDIVFFHNTDDHNADGRNNDWYTHVALVESHGDNANITLLGYRGGAVERFTMNLESPDASKTRHGEVANSQLRPKRSEDAPFTQYLAGQLFAGTCSVLGDKSELMVIDNWQPGMKLR